MKKVVNRIFQSLLLAALVAACAPTTSSSVADSAPQLPPYSGPKARLVVAQFTCEAATCASQGQAIGSGISDALLTALVQSNRFDVFESAETVLLLEAELNVSDTDSAFAAADLAVIGAVTEFTPDSGGGGGSVRVPIPFVSRVGGGVNRSTAALDLRVVDVRTRQVVAVTKVEGSASSFDARANTYFRGFDSSLGGYSDTSMETAVADMINTAVVELVNRVPAEYYGRPAPEPVAETVETEPQAEAAPAETETGIGGLESGVRLLPGTAFPFQDDFEALSLGQAVAVAAPQTYGVFTTNGVTDPAFARIEETFGAQGESLKTLQFVTEDAVYPRDTGRFLTLGSAESGDYRASFDVKMTQGTFDDDSQLVLQLNLGPAGTTRYEARIFTGVGRVTLDKVLGEQRITLLNRDGLGFDLRDDTFHRIEVMSSSSGQIQVSLDGRALINYSDADARYHRGGFGIGLRANFELPMYVDNLMVSGL